jgi:hypothetical protein
MNDEAPYHHDYKIFGNSDYADAVSNKINTIDDASEVWVRRGPLIDEGRMMGEN